MHCLRCFSAPLRGYQLPLTDVVAETLSRILLVESLDARISLLSAALGDSPALTVWAADCCLLHQISVGSQPDIETLARGIAENLAAFLRDAIDQFTPRSEKTGEVERLFAGAATAHGVGIEVARRAEARLEVSCQSGSQQESQRSEPHTEARLAYLLGLLHDLDAVALDSAHASPEFTTSSEFTVEGLLARLQPLLGTLAQAESRTAAGAVIASRVELKKSPPVSPPVLSPAMPHEWISTGLAAGEVTAAARLSSLVSKLCRLTRLEGEFEIALEEAKLQAMYKLAAGAGHEINNPLGSIAGRAQLLLRDESEPDRRRTLAKINSQAFRAHEMIADMMLFARPPKPEYEEILPHSLLEGLIEELQEITEQQEAQIKSHIADDLESFRADAAQLRVVLRAMCINALEASGMGGRIEIRVSRGRARKSLGIPTSPAATVQITVRDNGPGFSEEEREHLFDPFYSGREAGRGLGFGLSKCWRIIRNHGGRIDVKSDPGCGATFEIILPAA